MNWNKNHGCNFFKWVEDVKKGDEFDNGHALLMATRKQVEELNEKINELEKKIKKLDDMHAEKMDWVRIGVFSMFVILFVLLFKSV